MKPYGIDDAEVDLRTAIDADDLPTIASLEKVIDALDTHPPPVSLHAAALWYAEQGLKVFPVGAGRKLPLFPKAHPEDEELQRSCKGKCGRLGHGCHDATNDVEVVNEWWTSNSKANIGLATGHLVDVVDIDGPPGWRSRLDNWDAFSALEILGKVTTPRPGGVHLYVPATGMGNKAGLLPGIDYRSVGGYVIAPPSRIAAGSKDHPGTYSFVVPLDTTTLGTVAS